MATDDYTRVHFAYGKTAEEAFALREGIVDAASDAVVHPRNKKDVQKIVEFCNENKVPVYVYGGGSLR